MPATEQRTSSPISTAKAPRGPGLAAALIALAILVVVAIAAALVLIGDVRLPFTGDDQSPEDVVAEMIEAVEAQDLAILEDVYDPDVVMTIDATPVGFTEEIPDEVGRDTLLRNVEQEWLDGNLTFTEEIVSSEGQTVTTSLTITFPDGSFTRHEVTYFVSDNDQIYREEHLVVE